MLALLICFFVLFYVLVRLTALYLPAWTLVLSLITIVYVSFAAGRMAVEAKMLEIRKRGSAINSDEDIKLRDDEKSKIWKHAFKLYAAFNPLAIITPLLFAFTSLRRDVIL
jgi:hypothetical protein